MFFKAPYFGLWHWCWKTKLHSVALLDFGWRPKNASQESFSFAVISKTTSTYKSLYKSDELQRIVFNTDWALNHHNIAPHFVSVWVIQRSCWQDLNPSAVCFWKKKCLNTKVHWLSSAMWDDENNFKQMETENVTCHMNFHLMGCRQVDLSEDLKPQVCTCVCTWLFTPGIITAMSANSEKSDCGCYHRVSGVFGWMLTLFHNLDSQKVEMRL